MACPMLISVHIPKTGGTSFGAMLARHFGPRLLRDYDDRPLSHGGLARLSMAVFGMWTEISIGQAIVAL